MNPIETLFVTICMIIVVALLVVILYTIGFTGSAIIIFLAVWGSVHALAKDIV